MWFKNIQIYRFIQPFNHSAEDVEAKLADCAFTPCGSQDISRYGFEPPLGAEGPFVHVANGYLLVCARRQEKVLPAAVVNEELEQKVQDIQDEEGRRVGRKERQSLKDELIFTLLPRAFVHSTRQFAYISLREGLLIVNASSARRAEELLEALREALGSLPVVPVSPNNIPQDVMTGWLRDRADPEGFELGTECELRDADNEGGVIRCKKQLLTSSEIHNHIVAGMQVTRLELVSSNGIECILDDKFCIKRIRYGDMIQDKAGEVYTEDDAERFDVDFSIMTLELSAFIKSLLAAFGGENLADVEGDVIAA